MRQRLLVCRARDIHRPAQDNGNDLDHECKQIPAIFLAESERDSHRRSLRKVTYSAKNKMSYFLCSYMLN